MPRQPRPPRRRPVRARMRTRASRSTSLVAGAGAVGLRRRWGARRTPQQTWPCCRTCRATRPSRPSGACFAFAFEMSPCSLRSSVPVRHVLHPRTRLLPCHPQGGHWVQPQPPPPALARPGPDAAGPGGGHPPQSAGVPADYPRGGRGGCGGHGGGRDHRADTGELPWQSRVSQHLRAA